MICDEKSTLILIIFPLVVCFVCTFDVIRLSTDFFEFVLWGLLSFLTIQEYVLCQVWGVFSHYVFKHLFSSTFVFSSLLTLMTPILDLLS